VKVAFDHRGWQQAMIDKIQALERNGTWDLVPLPPREKVVGCWVYTIEVGPNGEDECLKARLVAKGYTQIYCLDYGDTFYVATKMTTLCLFFALPTRRHWRLHQLDIKKCFPSWWSKRGDLYYSNFCNEMQ